jgi:hypothetical protein
VWFKYAGNQQLPPALNTNEIDALQQALCSPCGMRAPQLLGNMLAQTPDVPKDGNSNGVAGPANNLAKCTSASHPSAVRSCHF